MGDSLPWTPINRRAKFYASSCILGGEIRNCTNTKTNKKQTSTPVFGDGRLPRHADPTSTRRAISRTTHVKETDVYCPIPMRVGRFFRFSASGDQSSPKWENTCTGRP